MSSIDKILKGASAKSRIKVEAYAVSIAHRYTDIADQASQRISELRKEYRTGDKLTAADVAFNAGIDKDIEFWSVYRVGASQPRKRF